MHLNPGTWGVKTGKLLGLMSAIPPKTIPGLVRDPVPRDQGREQQSSRPDVLWPLQATTTNKEILCIVVSLKQFQERNLGNALLNCVFKVRT